MPIITVNLLSGRTSSQKEALVRELAEGTVRALGVSDQSIRIILNEIEPNHWAIGSKTKAALEGIKQ